MFNQEKNISVEYRVDEINVLRMSFAKRVLIQRKLGQFCQNRLPSVQVECFKCMLPWRREVPGIRTRSQANDSISFLCEQDLNQYKWKPTR